MVLKSKSVNTVWPRSRVRFVEVTCELKKCYSWNVTFKSIYSQCVQTEAAGKPDNDSSTALNGQSMPWDDATRWPHAKRKGHRFNLDLRLTRISLRNNSHQDRIQFFIFVVFGKAVRIKFLMENRRKRQNVVMVKIWRVQVCSLRCPFLF